MNTRLALAAFSCALLFTVSARCADAQTARGGTRFDVGVGLGYGGGGGSTTRDQRTGWTLSALLMQAASGISARPISFGVSARQFDVVDNADDCQGSIDACFARYPQLRSVGAMAGIEFVGQPDRASSIRLLAGPAYVWSGDRRSLALESRLDVVLMPSRPVALVLSLESAVVSSLGDNSIWTGALGLGVRVKR